MLRQLLRENQYPSYDLETILDALPKSIRLDGCYEFLDIDYGSDYCSAGYGSYALPDNMRIRIKKKENESLADTVARLFIIVLKDGINQTIKQLQS